MFLGIQIDAEGDSFLLVCHKMSQFGHVITSIMNVAYLKAGHSTTSHAPLQIVTFSCSNNIDDTCKNSASKRFSTDIKYNLSSIQNV